MVALEIVWVNVYDGHPVSSERVLVLCTSRNGAVWWAVASWVADRWLWDDSQEVQGVTHWAYVPLPMLSEADI